jgi:plastocyanin
MMRGLSLTLAFSLVSVTGWAKEHVISQKGRQFSQTDLQIQPGDIVVFKNDDDTTHNVFTSSDSMKFNLGVQKAGTDSRHEFASEGEAEIRCAIHPKMKLKIVVKK